MKLTQAIVFLGIWFSNIEYGWTPNPVVAGICALMGTIFVTALIIEMRSRWSGLRSGRALTPPPAD